jgi:sialate O-acetylesterase
MECEMKRYGLARWVLISILLASAGYAESPKLTVNPLFANHAVLQNGQPVPVWGVAEPSREVSVSFAGQTIRAQAGEDGRWKAVLQPLEISSNPQTMTIESGAQKITLQDLLVGEVWLVCGRSNIGFPVSKMDNSADELKKAAQPLLRIMAVFTRNPSETPLDDFTSRGWVVSAPGTISGLSAVGWVFGSELQKARQVPVGIVQSSWGGSAATLWIEGSFYAAVKKGASPESPELATLEKESQKYHSVTDGQTTDQVGTAPGICFNSHIHPLIPMAMKGAVVFFDGSPAEDIGMLAQNWRMRWGTGNFPFIFIQVHRHGGPVEDNPSRFADSNRAGYVNLLKSLTNSAVVVALDCGVDGEKNIHPPNKRPVGERAALCARAIGYGEQIVYSGPVFSAVKLNGSTAAISFNHTGGGLTAKGDALEGFTVSSDGRNWSWGKAKIEGDQVIVESPQSIKAVRYAWGPNNPKGNLYNQEGLPASPFVTVSN